MTAVAPMAMPVQRTAGVVKVKVAPQQPIPDPGFADLAADKAPSEYKVVSNAKRVSNTPTLRNKQASSFEPALPLRGVSTNFASAVFRPNFTSDNPQLSRLSFATYLISTTGYTGLPTVGITWGDGPDDYSTYFVAVANRQTNRWQWFNGPIDDVITLGSLNPYKASNGDVMIMVLLTGTKECTLAGISLGPEETRGTGNGGLFGGGSGGSNAPPLFGSNLPASVDLSPMCSPVQNQGTLGSCTAFALGDGALNYEMKRVYGADGWTHSGQTQQIGTRYLYVETGKDQGLPCSPEGRYYDRTVNWLKQNGITLEATAPYYPTPCSDAWSQAALGDAAVLKPLRAEAVPCTTDAGITQVKTLLAQGRVVPCGLLLDNAFNNWTPQSPPWNYTGPNAGGHAMCIVGYDDSKQAFKVRNSWGPEWGDNGHCWIAYSAFKNPAAGAMCFVLEMERNQSILDRFFGGGGGGFPSPTNVQASDGTFEDKVRITWNTVPGATGYEVYRDLQSNLIQTTGAVTQFDDTTISIGNSHTYWVKAVQGTTKSGFSASDAGFAGSSGGEAPIILGVQYIPGNVGANTQFYVDYYSPTTATFNWTLGGCNPGNSNAESPTATFVTGGEQTISITVSNASGSDNVTGNIFIGGAGGPPVVVLEANPTSGAAPLGVVLDASGSSDDGYIVGFEWDWESDGIFDYSSYLYSSVYVTYPAGTWNTTVRVWDNEGYYSDKSITITVSGGGGGGYTEIEPNDSAPQATQINYGSVDTGSIGSGLGYPGYDGDIDDYWWLEVVGGGVTFETLMELNPSTGDLDLYIYDQWGNLGAFSEGSGAQEYFQVFLPAGIYVIRVLGFSGFSDYTLQYNAF